jgi:pyruvate,water dikinase
MAEQVDPNKVLATFYGDESFPVEWANEEEKKLFWFVDDNHCMYPLSPMYWSLNGWWGPTLEYMYRRFGFPLGKAWIGKRVNGYLYSAIVPRDPKEAEAIAPYYFWIMPTYADKFLEWWHNRYLPEILRNFEYLDTFPTETATLQELMVFLEEAIDIQERHFRLHWILNLAQFQSSLDFQAAVKEVIGDVDPTLIGRILISNKDRNWDSLEAMWKLKEKVKADPDLKAIFDAGETASAIMPALEATEKGRAFMADVHAYAKEYGYKAIFPHEYINKLWVEDVTPIIETIKGYLASDYDFPSAYKHVLDDQKAAIDELMSMVPTTATPEQRAKLKEKLDLAVKMMPLTPDHHFYMDQGTFGRMRLVLLAIGRRLTQMGLLDDPEDILFLEYDQLRQYVANPKTDANPNGFDGKAVVKRARREWEKAWKIRPRSWIGTVTYWSMYIEPYHTLWGWPQRFEREQAGLAEAKDVVRGLPASPGMVEGTARVVWGPDEFGQVKKGEIVVCITTNPAWVVVFSKISGLVTDTGGVLAHPGVVAREFGIPAVVGTGDATARIKTGDRIRVNGNTGEVEILG